MAISIVDTVASRPAAVRRTIATALTGAALLAGGLLAVPAEAAPVSTSRALAVKASPLPGSVKHTDGKYWAFFAPRGWIASYGAYGITVSSPSGRDAIDYGFSSVLCARGNSFRDSAANYLNNQRQQVLASSGLTRIKVKTATFTQLPPAKYGPNYFRATTAFKGRSASGPVKARMINDYSFYDTTYCYNRNLSFGVPKKRAKKRFVKLGRVYETFAYFGPGACDPQNETSCPNPPKP